jgi:predicted aldo/keto reductase-like oxidoreductase
MDYVRLGSSGLKVSRLCLGTLTYGTPKWRPRVLDEAASRPFIKCAIEHGANFFDTAETAAWRRGVRRRTVRAPPRARIRSNAVALATFGACDT